MGRYHTTVLKPYTRLTVNMPDALLAQVRAMAADEGYTVGALVRVLLSDAAAAHQPRHGPGASRPDVGVNEM